MVINSMKDKEDRKEPKQKRFKKEGRKTAKKEEITQWIKKNMNDNAETFVWINDLLYLNMGIRVSPLLINSSISMIVNSKKNCLSLLCTKKMFCSFSVSFDYS